MLGRPGLDGLGEVVAALRDWQYDGAPMQLHPGDVGWYWRFGAEATAAAVWTWSRNHGIVAVGLIDGPAVLRLAIAPEAQDDEELARRMLADVTRCGHGVLPRRDTAIEVRAGGRFRTLLCEHGWGEAEPWTPLSRRLVEPVEDCGLRIEPAGPEQARVRAAVQRAAFVRSTFTARRWHAMAAGVAYADARCLVAYDARDRAVAAATVWSAGPGRPGLLEPVGVHRDHRGRGHGTAITLAAAAALRRLGSSSAIVCTSSSNVAAVATYRSAGFQQLSEVPDLRRLV